MVADLRNLGLSYVRVVDNGSRDNTATAARDAGAHVIAESRRGYGQACIAGVTGLDPQWEWILFCDADGSDDLSVVPEFFEWSHTNDFILEDRRRTAEGRGAMTFAQNLGNGLATYLVGVIWGFRYHDLGPLRLIRRSSFDQLTMKDRNYGWTVEMQIRAIELGVRIREIPVRYLPRKGGRSKISGTVKGTLMAGSKIIWTIARYMVTKSLARSSTADAE